MTLNTYAAFLPYLQVPPRQNVARSDIVMTMTKPVKLLTGRLWHGYDEYSCFEAAVTVWLNPSTKTGNVYLGGVYQHRHRLQMPYGVGFPGRLATYTSPVPMQNDYYELHQLHDLAPINVPAGSTITVNRDFFNIAWPGTPQNNAWDIEVLIVVDE